MAVPRMGLDLTVDLKVIKESTTDNQGFALNDDQVSKEIQLTTMQRLALKYTGEPDVWALYQMIITYMSESSLFILHRNTRIRQFFLKLTTAPVIHSYSQKDILLS